MYGNLKTTRKWGKERENRPPRVPPRAFVSLLPSPRALYFPSSYSPPYRKDERDRCGGERFPSISDFRAIPMTVNVSVATIGLDRRLKTAWKTITTCFYFLFVSMLSLNIKYSKQKRRYRCANNFNNCNSKSICPDSKW